MAGFAARVDALRKLPPGRRLGAIAQAVRDAPDEDVETLGTELIELALIPERASSARREVADAALVEVARTWRRFGPCLRRITLAAGRGRWEDALRVVVADSDPAARYAAVRVAQESGDPVLAPLLADMLADPDRRIAAAAGAGLLRLCARASGVESRALLGSDAPSDVLAKPMDPGAPDAADAADELAGIVARCMAGASIRRTRQLALCAMVLLPRPFEADQLGPGRARLASELRSSDDHAGVRAALRRSDSAVARRLALWWLADRAVAPAALERLGRAESIAEHEAVLRAWHLLARPARRHRVRRMQVRTRPVEGATDPRSRLVASGGPLPDGATLCRLSAQARTGLPALVEALALDEATRSAALGPLVTDPEPSVRFAAARAASAAELPDYCLDPDPIVARTATLLWSAVGGVPSGPRPSDAARRRFAGRLCLSPHRCVRLIAEADRDRLDPLDPDSAASRLAARRLLALNPDELVSMLRGLLVQAAEAPRLRALGVVRRFGLHRQVEDALLTLAAGGAGATDREVATAVAASATPARRQTPMQRSAPVSRTRTIACARTPSRRWRDGCAASAPTSRTRSRRPGRRRLSSSSRPTAITASAPTPCARCSRSATARRPQANSSACCATNAPAIGSPPSGSPRARSPSTGEPPSAGGGRNSPRRSSRWHAARTTIASDAAPPPARRG
ncbi:MAG: hypothetical protein M5U20_03780 [Phycisphaerales bacterium]|nr:hypothetical protein [Phycisphaerales bacterium]